MDQLQPQSNPLPASLQKRNLPPGHAGYYNHTRSPLTFTSTFANRGPATIDPGKAVRHPDGSLVEWDPDLERQVSDGCLKRILPNDPRYTQFVSEGDKLKKRQSVVTTPNAAVQVGSAQDKGDASKLQYETDVVDETTYYLYDGQRFSSMSGMNAYARSKGDIT